jgi:hypothetical protein
MVRQTSPNNQRQRYFSQKPGESCWIRIVGLAILLVLIAGESRAQYTAARPVAYSALLGGHRGSLANQ